MDVNRCQGLGPAAQGKSGQRRWPRPSPEKLHHARWQRESVLTKETEEWRRWRKAKCGCGRQRWGQFQRAGEAHRAEGCREIQSREDRGTPFPVQP